MSFLPYSQINNGISPAFSYFNILIFSSLNETQTLVFPGTFLPSTYYFSAFMNISAASGITGCEISLPDSTYGAPGNAAIFYNTGGENILLVDSLGQEIITLAPSSVWEVILSNNNTWDTFQLGLTTSQVNAQALAGAGLLALNAKLNLNVPILTKSQVFTIDPTYRANLINWTGGSETVTLPAATGLPSGFFFYFKNNSDALFTFSVSDSSQKFDGLASLTFSPNQSCMIYTDGLNWFTEGLGNSANSSGVKLTPDGIQVVNGSASTPSYSFINSQNTGLFLLPSTSNIGFSISGTEIMELNSQGINYLASNSGTSFSTIGGIPYAYLQPLVSI